MIGNNAPRLDADHDQLARLASAVSDFEMAFDRPDITIADMQLGPERRLANELAAFVAPGPAAAERAVQTHLASTRADSAVWAQALVLALLAQRRYDLVFPVLAEVPEKALPGAIRGIALGGDTGFDARIVLELGSPSVPVLRTTWLETIAQRRLLPPTLAPALASQEPEVLAAALRASTGAAAQAYRKAIVGLLRHPEPSVRHAAMVAGLHVASRRAWSLCKDLAFEETEPTPVAMLLVAGLGTRDDHVQLARRLESAVHRPHAIRALGFAGDVTWIPTMLEIVSGPDRTEAKLAAEAVATIAGLDVSAYGTAAPRPDRRDGVGMRFARVLGFGGRRQPSPRSPEDYLPEPDAAALRSWWSDNHACFRADQRYLGGKPRSLAVVVEMLAQMPLRRTQVLGQLLSTRTGGKLWVDPRALTSLQRIQISRAAHKTSTGPAKLREAF